MISSALKRYAKALRVCARGKPVAVGGLPVALVSTANHREHPLAKARRIRALRTAARLRAAGLVRGNGLELPLVVRIVRVAPRAHHELDRDNLENGAKAIRDGIADALHVDDRDPRLEFVVDQELVDRGAPFVALEVYRP